jgi:hypothetical protein
MSKLLPGWLLLVLAVIAGNSAEARGDWSAQQDPQFGFKYSYPAELFVSTKGERPSFYYFRSQETDANFWLVHGITRKATLQKSSNIGC